MEQTWAVKSTVLGLRMGYTVILSYICMKGGKAPRASLALFPILELEIIKFCMESVPPATAGNQVLDVKTRPAFILTQGVSSFLCSFVLFHISMHRITPCQCK